MKIARQRVTAAAIIEQIKNRYDAELKTLIETESQVMLLKARLETIKNILTEAEKKATADDE